MKKIAVILASVLIALLMVVKLMSNKQKIDNNLKAMTQYTTVVPVKIIKPIMDNSAGSIKATGVLKAGAEVTILSETSGSVLSVAVKVGDIVKSGQLLATVDKELLESQLPLAKQTMENTENDLKRYMALIETDAVTQQQLEAAKSAYQSAKASYASLSDQLTKKEIRAPVAGTVSSRFIEKGATLMPSVPLFSIVEQNRMTFTVSLTESEIAAAEVGKNVSLQFDAFSGKQFEGKVRSAGVIPDLSGRYKIEVDVENINHELRAGMSGEAVFTYDVNSGALVLPRKCIVGSIKDAKVFAIDADSVVEHKIRVQALNDTSVLVLDGLSANETVVLSGQMNLRNGTKVRILNNGTAKQ